MAVAFIAQTILWATTAAAGPALTEAFSADGRVWVRSGIGEHRNEDGSKSQNMIYRATMQSDVRPADVIAVLKNVSAHGAIIDEKRTELVRQLGENQWLIYYYFDLPWPLRDADMVATMTLVKQPQRNRTEVRIEATPDLMPATDVARLRHYNLIYAVESDGAGGVRLSHEADVTPAFEVPDFMMRSYFPEGPADTLKRLESLARQRGRAAHR